MGKHQIQILRFKQKCTMYLKTWQKRLGRHINQSLLFSLTGVFINSCNESKLQYIGISNCVKFEVSCIHNKQNRLLIIS